MSFRHTRVTLTVRDCLTFLGKSLTEARTLGEAFCTEVRTTSSLFPSLMISSNSLPQIIQGGMGVGVSGWQLASAVACCGQLGVVSGTALDTTLVRRLQDGDVGGHLRRAMAAFPIPEVSDVILRRYYCEGGRAPGQPYALAPMYMLRSGMKRQQLTVLASFVEVFLAREGHEGTIGINLLTKLQLPNLALLYGAMLAGVDYVLMGAGIPREIPAALDALSLHQTATLRLDVEGETPGTSTTITFNPQTIGADVSVPLKRPRFVAIVASHSLATTLARKSVGKVDGFVIEGPTAGGHNAPARGTPTYNELGEPVYGDRDIVDLDKIRELGLPFWLAGGAGTPDELTRARAEGAAGIQVGTLFAYCNESGFSAEIKHTVLEHAARGDLRVFTDPRASPTGYPFKVVQLEPAETLPTRQRLCDLGYLRTAYARAGGQIGFRCPAEPVDDYVRKGGRVDDTIGRQCMCNGLVSAIGLPQLRDDGTCEPSLITSGNALLNIRQFLGTRSRYAAKDVLEYLHGQVEAAASV
jgi:nitronate monooxygenase